MRRYLNAFRLAAYTLVLYALGHTMGAVIGTPKLGTESDTVVALMKSVHVQAQGADCTWYGFYRGFGILVTVCFLLSAYVAWQLGGANEDERRALRPIGWALFAGYVVNLVVAVVYFFPMPTAFAAAVAVLLGIGCIRSPGPMRATHSHEKEIAS